MAALNLLGEPHVFSHLHPLLARQLRGTLGEAPPADGPLATLLEAVSREYSIADDERQAALLMDTAVRERAEVERDALFRTSPDLLCIIDGRRRFAQLSPSWQWTLGYAPEDLAGTEVLELTHPEDHERAAQFLVNAVETSAQDGLEVRLRTSTGAWRWSSWTATYDAKSNLICAIGRDTTAQRAVADELAQAQKLEAIGQLATGIAHEINTPVQFVGDNLSFLSEGFRDLMVYLERVQQVLNRAPPGTAAHAELAEAQKAADLDYLREEVPRALAESKDGVRRVGELVKAMKESAHLDRADKAPADVNRAIERSVVLARSELKYIAKVELDLHPVPELLCHVGSLSQVFINLLVNAAHAIEERGTRPTPPGWQRLIKVQSAHIEDEIVLRFSDTGCGIPDSLRERIYEPFFTTKPLGKGSGQGMPLVRNVILGTHKGRIELETAVDVGTTFILRLPLDLSDAAPAPAPASATRPSDG
jgi:PAS domain S-box-containing protein